MQLCYRHPQYGLALTWIAVQEATTYAEHVIDVGRRTPVERLSHFLLELHARLKTVGRAEQTRFTLPFSQEVIADVLGLSVPHLNRMMQQLRAEKLIADSERVVEFLDAGAMQTLAHYQPQALAPIPPPTRGLRSRAVCCYALPRIDTPAPAPTLGIVPRGAPKGLRKTLRT